MDMVEYLLEAVCRAEPSCPMPLRGAGPCIEISWPQIVVVAFVDLHHVWELLKKLQRIYLEAILA